MAKKQSRPRAAAKVNPAKVKRPTVKAAKPVKAKAIKSAKATAKKVAGGKKPSLPKKVPLPKKGKARRAPAWGADDLAKALALGTEFKPHPLAEVFPLITGDEFGALVEDVRTNGLLHPIVLHEGLILDGRNRYRACRAANVPLRFDVYAGDDPIAFVMSLNMRRRDLNPSQRAFAIAELEKFKHGGARRGDGFEGKSRKDRAREGNVSERTVASGAVVRDHGTEELKQAVRAGQVTVDKAEQLALLPAAEQKEIVARGEKEIVAKAREIRAEKSRKRHAARLEKMGRIAANNAPLPVGKKYAVIYADPPTKFETWGEESGSNRAAPYPTLTIDEICALDVGSLAMPNAILFLWLPRQHLLAAQRIAQAWGPVVVDDPVYGPIRQAWTYRADYVWNKVDFGLGYWNRDQHEFLLIFTLGDVPLPLPELRIGSVYSEKRGEHSAKPAYFRHLINLQYGTLPKIELFAREAKPGWDVWGNQAPAEGAPADDLFARLYANADGLVEVFEDANGRGSVLQAAASIDQNLRVSIMRERPGPLLEAVANGDMLPAEILDFLAEQKLARGRKAPKLTHRGEDVLAEWRKAEAERAELAALPSDIEELIADYGRTLALRHANILDALVEDAANDARRLRLLQKKANGGTSFGMDCDDSPAERLRRENAAVPGAEPMWNQIGLFRIDIDGTPYIVSHDDHGHFGVHAEDATKPFCSETGYRSFGGLDGPAFGCTVAHQAEAFIREAVATETGSDGKRKSRTKKTAMQLPEVVYRIPASWSDYPDDERFGEPIRAGGEHPWERERREAEEKKAATRERKATLDARLESLDRYERDGTYTTAECDDLVSAKLIVPDGELAPGASRLTATGTKRLASWRATQEKRAAREAVKPPASPADATPAVVRACRVCGCTDDHACEGGCSWVSEDPDDAGFNLCTACMDKAAADIAGVAAAPIDDTASAATDDDDGLQIPDFLRRPPKTPPAEDEAA